MFGTIHLHSYGQPEDPGGSSVEVRFIYEGTL